LKYIIILADGAADYPLEQLNNKTPLMVADKPAIDTIAKFGRTGLFQTITQDMPTGSAVANLSVLGYDPKKTFNGRGVLEAASLGIQLAPADMAMRINLICAQNSKIFSHSAGHITDEEAGPLINDLKEYFSKWNIKIYQGLSYRHVLVVPDGNEHLECAPPHDHIGQDINDVLVKPLDASAKQTADLLNQLINESYQFLKSHPVNKKRIQKGQQPANMLWPWSPGKKPQMKTFQERFGINGATISAVHLIKGLAFYAGLDVINVEGATGLYNTNYEGKADACLKALDDHDFVFVHVEATDEAGHDRNLDLKIKCIEYLDRRLVKRILDGLKKKNIQAVVAILPDHPTPITHGAHTRDPVPVAIWDPQFNGDSVKQFDEESVKSGSLGFLKGDEFIKSVLKI
jgi:2,3-bisphosphoglycerate-independent phosphoglycerate mutase